MHKALNGILGSLPDDTRVYVSLIFCAAKAGPADNVSRVMNTQSRMSSFLPRYCKTTLSKVLNRLQKTTKRHRASLQSEMRRYDGRFDRERTLADSYQKYNAFMRLEVSIAWLSRSISPNCRKGSCGAKGNGKDGTSRCYGKAEGNEEQYVNCVNLLFPIFFTYVSSRARLS